MSVSLDRGAGEGGPWSAAAVVARALDPACDGRRVLKDGRRRTVVWLESADESDIWMATLGNQ